MAEYLYGRQPVREMLRAGRRAVQRVWLPAGGKPSPELDEIQALARQHGARLASESRGLLDRLVGDVNHQGVVAEVSAFPYLSQKDLHQLVEKTGNRPFLLFLDHLEDPQNLGSLLRTADSAGVHAVVIPKDRAAPVTPTVVRTSAGAAEHIRVAMVTNLVQCMKDLQPLGLWFYGLDAVPDAVLYTETDLSGPVALVVGSEGRGMKRLVRETCDFLIRLPQAGRVSSLNAAVAGAVAMYEVRRQRGPVEDSARGQIP
jgi:23S rRNA (guanosine2251-2'-O)-methyltransferase